MEYSNALDMRTELDRISSLQISFLSDSSWERSRLVSELAKIETQMNMLAGNRGTPTATAWTDFEARQSRLSARIDNAVASHKLSSSQVRMLRGDLRRINQRAWQARSDDGVLSASEMAMIKQQQFDLHRSISTELADTGVRFY